MKITTPDLPANWNWRKGTEKFENTNTVLAALKRANSKFFQYKLIHCTQFGDLIDEKGRLVALTQSDWWTEIPFPKQAN